MDSTRFVYVTYIRSDWNKVWEALTTDEISREFWFDSRQESQWEKGLPWRMSAPDGRLVNSGEVLSISRRGILRCRGATSSKRIFGKKDFRGLLSTSSNEASPQSLV
jgi:uncharacterized protein YndB with AHSA1/START domain